MCELVYNRITGLIIGSSIADSLGSLVKYAPNIMIQSPQDSYKIDMEPGYWTEPTALMLTVLTDRTLDDIVQQSTGVMADYNFIHGTLVRAGALSVIHHGDFYSMIIHADKISGAAGKIWAAILDTTIHGGHKRTILSRSSYANLYLPDNIWEIFDRIQLDTKHQSVEDNDWIRAEDLLTEVLQCFRTTDNYKDGLIHIINNSIYPDFAGALYGQIAGAYYGLTDIPIEWLDTLQGTDLLISTFESRKCV